MFKSIRFVDNQEDMTGGLWWVYRLVDSEFNCLVKVHRGSGLGAIIQEYKARQLNVAKNIAQYYLTAYGDRMQTIEVHAEDHADYLDESFPELEYSKRYMQCAINQIKMLQYGKKR